MRSLPASTVSWLPENYEFPGDLFQDLVPEDREALRNKIAKCDACQFPEFVSKSSQENVKFFNQVSQKSSVELDSCDFGGKLKQLVQTRIPGSPRLKICSLLAIFQWKTKLETG